MEWAGTPPARSASQESVDTVYGMVKRGIGNLRPLEDPLQEEDVHAASRLLESAVQAATYMVFSMAEMDRGKSGMGTTISAMLVLGEYMITAQVGDSRIYRIRGPEVEQLTEDHTLIAWQLKQRADHAARGEEVTASQREITRAVGNRDYVQVDTGLVSLMPMDRFLVCSGRFARVLGARRTSRRSPSSAARMRCSVSSTLPMSAAAKTTSRRSSSKSISAR